MRAGIVLAALLLQAASAKPSVNEYEVGYEHLAQVRRDVSKERAIGTKHLHFGRHGHKQPASGQIADFSRCAQGADLVSMICL